jgi:prophage regulatory protein
MNDTTHPLIQRLEVLRLRQVCQVTGLCRSTIYQLEADKRFPRRIKVGDRSVGWIDREVQEWLADRVQRSRSESS